MGVLFVLRGRASTALTAAYQTRQRGASGTTLLEGTLTDLTSFRFLSSSVLLWCGPQPFGPPTPGIGGGAGEGHQVQGVGQSSKSVACPAPRPGHSVLKIVSVCDPRSFTAGLRATVVLRAKREIQTKTLGPGLWGRGPPDGHFRVLQQLSTARRGGAAPPPPNSSLDPPPRPFRDCGHKVFKVAGARSFY